MSAAHRLARFTIIKIHRPFAHKASEIYHNLRFIEIPSAELHPVPKTPVRCFMEQEVRHGEKAVYAGAYSGRSETGRAIKATRNRRDHGNSLRRVTLEKRSPGRDSNRHGLTSNRSRATRCG